MVRQQSSLRRVLVGALVSSLVVLTSPHSIAHAADGDLDVTFDSDGVMAVDISGGATGDYGTAVVVQPDGKIIMGGGSSSQNDFGLVRLNTNGTFDTSFSGDGKLISNLAAGADSIVALALQSDGKIIAAGIAHNGTNIDYAVARYLSNGTLDTTFDSDGFNTASLTSDHDFAEDVVIQPDGKIIVIGSATGLTDDIGLVRFNTDGSLDSGFGTGGKLITSLSSSARDNGYGVALQPDGKILVTGLVLNASMDVALVRYNANGTLDNTFDSDGIVTTDIAGRRDEGRDVVVQSDGKIVVSATTNSATTGNDFASIRYNTNGSLDTSYSGDGILPIPVNTSGDLVYASALQTDDKLLIAGSTLNGVNTNIAVVRVKTDGTLDSTFGTAGIITKDYSSQTDEALDVVLQPNGKVVFAGYTADATRQYFVLGRLDAVSTNAKLSSVVATSATLSPTFAAGTNAYTTTVSSSVSSITITPTLSDSNGSVKVNGTTVASGSASGSIALSEGTNTITVVATAQDGTTTNTYTITVTRSAAPPVVTPTPTPAASSSPTTPTTLPSTNASLSSISLSSVTLTPSFESATTSYTATVSNGTKSTSVTPTVADSTATVKVNGTMVAAGSSSASIALTPGLNTITVVATAQDGTTTKSYSFAITRDNATVKVKRTITSKSLLSSRDVSFSSTSKVVITVKTSSKKYCSVSGTKVKGVKKGNCTVVVAVTPKATNTVKKPKTTKTTVTVRVI